MNIMIRILVTLISGVASLYCVFWFAIPMSFSLHHPLWVSGLGSCLVGALVAWYVWMLTASFRASLARSALLGALAAGTMGFSAGFFGPLLSMPGGGASVGSIFWSIILGPAGLILGAVGGVVHWYAREGRAGSTGNWPKTDAG
jgi:hypothetical protein